MSKTHKRIRFLRELARNTYKGTHEAEKRRHRYNTNKQNAKSRVPIGAKRVENATKHRMGCFAKQIKQNDSSKTHDN